MADEYDGRVRINTELDNSGFEKGSDQLKASVSGLARAINGITGSMTSFFSKRWKMPEPELPEKEEMELPQPDPVKPEVDTTALDAGTRRVHQDMERITRDVGADLPEPKPVEPELDSSEFDKQAGKMQSSISRIVGEIDRMVSTSSQGFRSTTAVLSFNNKLDLTAEKIAEAREQLAEFAEQQIPTDQYAETTASIQKAEAALLKLYDRRDQMADLGVDENSKQWQKLELQIAAAEEEVERYEMAADRMRETGLAFVDPAATEQYAAMVEQIEQAERDIEANAGMIRQEQIEQARLNVLIAQEKYAHASNAVSRQLALRQLQNAQNALAMVAEKSVTPAPDPAAGSAWRRLGQTIKSGVSGAANAVKQFGALASKVTSGVKGLTSKVKGLFSGIGKKGSVGLDGLLKKFTGIKRMLATRIKRTFISFLFNQIKESFNELAKFDNRFDQSVSNLRNRTSELGANTMAAFGGLIRQIEPIITKAIDAASQAITKLNAVMTAIRGEDTMQIAVRRTESYADSLRDAAKAAKDDQKAQEKLNATLTSIDEIHKLDAPKDDDLSTNAGTDAEKVVYENVPVDSILGKMSDFGRKIADQIVQGIRSGDWRVAGTAISEGLNSVVQKIDDGIWHARDKVLQKAHDIAELLNGMVDGFDARALGTTIGDGINLALDTAYTFLETFDWSKFGQRTVEGLNGLVDRLDPRKIGQTISSTLNAAIDWAYEVFSGFEWDKAGAKLAQSLNEFVKNVKWDKAAKTVSAAISGLINSAASFLENADWKEIGQAIVDFFKNIDYASIVSAIVRFIGAAIGSIAALMKAIFEALIDTGEKWGEKLFERYGDQFDAAGGSIGDGILAGLKAVFTDIKNWVKKNIVDPFVKGFKKAFGISSPSKEVKPYGGYVGEGILEGIAGIFSDITNWVKTHIVEPFKRGFSTAFSVVGDKANALFENGKSIANGIKGGITAGWSAISTLIKGKKDDLKKDSEELADSAVSGFSDTSKFTKAGQKVVDGVSGGLSSGNLQDAGGSIMDSLGRGINDSYDEKVGRIVTQRTKQIGDTILDPGVADFEWAGKTIDERVGDGIWDAYDVYIKSDVTKRAAQIADDFRYNADYYGAGAYAAEMFSAGVRENYATAIKQFEGIAPTEWTTAMLQAFYGVQRAEKSWNDTNIRTVDSLRTIKTVAAEAAAEAENLNGKEVRISVDGAASALDKVADKLAGIARTFDAIGKAFSDMTTLPVPAVAMGAIAPAQTRVTDDSRNDGITATLIERLIGRIEELEEAVANRPIRVESKVMIDQREIGRATADYNANNNRVTNGNGGASW